MLRVLFIFPGNVHDIIHDVILNVTSIRLLASGLKLRIYAESRLLDAYLCYTEKYGIIRIVTTPSRKISPPDPDKEISLTGTPDQCMSLVGYDRPPLQAPSIYIPYKDAVTCRNRAWTGPLPIAAGRFWHDSDTLRHLYTSCRRCRAKKCHIWWWSTQGWCLLIFGSRVQTHMYREGDGHLRIRSIH